jgi:uncharacterized protein YkwD
VPRLRHLTAGVLAVTATALIAAAPAAASSCVGGDIEAEALGQTELETTVTCLINEERAKAGIRPVRANASLRRAAAGHSNDMVQDGFFEHTSPSGRTFIDRISNTGYTRGARRWLVGENLVWGSGSQSTPQSLVEAWMGSPAHRENLLRERFREVGVAAARGTPFDASEANGVTISSEYGFRAGKRVRPLRRNRSGHQAARLASVWRSP